MGKRKQFEVMALSLVLILVGACAQTSFLLNKEKLTPFEEFSSVSAFQPGVAVMSVSVTDNRENRQFLGMAKTGASYSDTPFVTSEGVSNFLERYYNLNLKKRGLVFTDQSETQLEIVIKELWVDELQERFKGERAKCSISIEVFAKRGMNSFKGEYWTKIKSAGNLSDGSEHLAPTLASCLNLSIEKMATDNKLNQFLK